MGKDKRYLTIDEQISLLESKGLIIDSKKNAIKYLNEIGYYKLINGYREPFLYNLNGEKRFVDDTSIQNLYDLYTFDHKLRVLFFNFISDCEIVIKNRMSELISRKYGINHKIYLQSSNFKQDGNVQTKFEDLKLSICKEISKQKLKNNCLNWYSKNYKYYPFWVLNTVLSFGTISKIYSRMIQADQYEISSYFNLKSDVFESFLLNLTLFRNVCAHNERFYNFRTRNKIKKRDIEHILKYFNIEEYKGNYKNGVNDVLSVIIIFSFILNKTQFNDFILQLKSLLKKFKSKTKMNISIYQQVLKSMRLCFDLIKLDNLQVESQKNKKNKQLK